MYKARSDEDYVQETDQATADTKADMTTFELLIFVGPVGQTVAAESKKTSAEFSDLMSAKEVPSQTTATGQPLTRKSVLVIQKQWQHTDVM